jgi:hypothetical protein
MSEMDPTTQILLRIERLETTTTASFKALETSIKSEAARINDKLDPLAEDVWRKDGLKDTVMLMSDRQARQDWFTKTAIGAAIASAVASAWSLISGGHH